MAVSSHLVLWHCSALIRSIPEVLCHLVKMQSDLEDSKRKQNAGRRFLGFL
jgi:hypothetical protein